MTLSLSILVFAAVSVFAGVILVTFYRALVERAEAGGSGDDVAVSPIRRFVTPVGLIQRRLVSSALSAVAIVALLSLNGVRSLGALAFVASVAAVVGWFLPMAWYRIKIAKRKERFDVQILNLAMTLANGLRSGMALPQALDAAAQRIGPPMREELAVVMRECRLGLDLPESLERLHRRMPGEDLRLLITSIRLTLQTGGSLADVLERMIEMIRARTDFQNRIKNKTAQGKFEAVAMSMMPLVVYVLLRLIDPDLMRPLTNTAIGWCAIGAVCLLDFVGFLVIKKIVTIEV